MADIFGHLNQLILRLLGRGKTVVDIVEKLEFFTRRLKLLELDLTARLLCFRVVKTQGP